MRKLAWLLLLSIWGCATLSPEEAAERRRETDEQNQRIAMQQGLYDRCLQGMPIFRGDPPYQYRVIHVIEAQDENELVRAACQTGADAVMSTFTANEETTTTVGGGPYFVRGRTKTKRTATFIGRLIKYVR